MANIVYSTGYTLEKIHTGLFAYLCDLYNEGDREPLGSFMEPLLGTPLKTLLKGHKVFADREWRGIDLVISDEHNNCRIAGIERCSVWPGSSSVPPVCSIPTSTPPSKRKLWANEDKEASFFPRRHPGGGGE